MSKRRPGRTTIIAALLLALGTGSAGAGTATVVLTGQAAPGGGTFISLGAPVLNGAGQVAFRAPQSDPTSGVGIYLGSGGPLTLVARMGAAAPGGGTFSGFVDPMINGAGQSMFWASQSDPTNNTGIYLGAGGSLTLIAREGAAAPGGGTFREFHNLPGMNSAGQVAFWASQSDPVNDQGLYLGNGGPLTLIARKGAAAPGGGNFTDFSRDPALNNAGQVAFRATQSDPTNSEGIYLNSGSALSLIARAGAAAQGGGNFTSFFDKVALNDGGLVAFRAFQSDPTNNEGIYLGNGGALTLLARKGAAAPGGGTFTGFVGTVAINAPGQVAFRATQSDPVNNEGVYRSTGSSLTLIARKGASVPGGDGTFATLSAPHLSSSGAALFLADIAGSSGGANDNQAIYLGDGTDIIEVMRKGRALTGRTLGELYVWTGADTGGASSVNDRGQVTYLATFTDGSRGIFVFTPDLRWRRSFSSSWDSAGNWTLGLAPGSVHDVKIDPAASLTVSGPTTDRSVRTLQIGGGSGVATLDLQAGARITVLGGPLEILGGGVLTGDGAIGSAATNRGTVLAENVSFVGALTNHGLVRGNTGANVRIAAGLDNQSAGRVRVESGERAELVGNSHSNSGQISVNTGRLEMSGSLINSGLIEVLGGQLTMNDALTNTSTGSINAINGQLRFNAALSNAGQLSLRDSVLRFNGGLTNTATGLVGVSFGTSDIFGRVTNQGIDATSRGRIIVSGGANLTFYDAVTNNGELRVSAGANAVFFGPVNGIGAFTGSGAKFFEGGYSPGLSPAFVELEGPVTLGTSSTLEIELAGLRHITEAGVVVADGYDRVKVNGLLDLLGGPLQVVLLGGFEPGEGARFDFLDWTVLQGSFGNVSLPALAPGLRWDDSRLYVDGSIGVTAVPEPQAGALWLAGLGALGVMVRRRGGSQRRWGPAALLLGALAWGAGAGDASAQTFLDDFDGPSLSPRWQAAGMFAGPPVVYLGGAGHSFASVGGASVLRAQGTLSNFQRVGWTSTDVFQGDSFHYEVRFNTLVQGPATSIDSFMEISIVDATNPGRSDVLLFFGNNFGVDRRVFTASFVDGTNSNQGFAYQDNTWYRMVIEGSALSPVRLSVLSDAGAELFGQNLAHTAAAYAAGFRVGLSQSMGAPNRPSPVDVAIDWVTVSAVPEPGTWALLGSGLAGLAGVVRRRTRAAAA